MAFIDRTIKEKLKDSDLFGYRNMLTLRSISEQPEELLELTPKEIVELEEDLNNFLVFTENAITSIQDNIGEK